MKKLLEGITVLDLSNVLSGPFCGFQLTLLGARVIKVERPGSGDLARSLGEDAEASNRLLGSTFVATNCGKESVTLDFKQPEGRTVLLKLIANSDVLIENFRPGVMQRLGLGFEEVIKVKPTLIYCSITGFGQTGPLASRAAYDQIIQGMSGVMSITGSAETAPLRTGFPLCDTIGGLTGAFAICAALYNAKVSGKGSYLDVSMLESTLATMGWVVSNHLNAGTEAKPNGNENVTSAPSGTFETADKPMNIAANEEKQFVALCNAIGRPDLISNALYITRGLRKKNRESLRGEIESALKKNTRNNWQSVFDAAGIPAGPIYTVAEIMSHPQIDERKFVDRRRSDKKQNYVRGGFMVDGESLWTNGDPPPLSADTDRHLQAVGYTQHDIDNFRHRGIV